MKIKITKNGIRRIQDRILKSLTEKEQKTIGLAMIGGMSELIASDLEKDKEAIKVS